jgi:hypothetical protein
MKSGRFTNRPDVHCAFLMVLFPSPPWGEGRVRGGCLMTGSTLTPSLSLKGRGGDRPYVVRLDGGVLFVNVSTETATLLLDD